MFLCRGEFPEGTRPQADVELARLIPGENMPRGEHRISPSNSAKSFQFGTKSQIAAHHTVYREGRRISKFNNSFLNFQIKKDDDLERVEQCLADRNYHSLLLSP